MKQEFTVTTPTLDDVESMNAMWNQSWLDTYPNEAAGVTREWVEKKIGTWDSQENIAKRKQQLLDAQGNPDAMWRVAKDREGKVLGVAAPYRDENVQHLGAIYVDKNYHGSGVARALMKEILAWADPMRPLELEVAAYNERAKAFYRKYGFKETSGTGRMHHGVIPVIAMIRKGGEG